MNLFNSILLLVFPDRLVSRVTKVNPHKLTLRIMKKAQRESQDLMDDQEFPVSRATREKEVQPGKLS